MCFAPSVLRTLFHINFDVVRSQVWVESYPRWLIRFLPTVIWMRWGSPFCGRKLTTMCAYITVWFCGMQEISLWVITKIEFVPFCLIFRSPCASHITKFFFKCCLPCFSHGGVAHQPIVAADNLLSHGMHHWHSYLLVVEACWCQSGHELSWRVNVWWVCPNAVGKKMYSLLTYDVIMA